jgi:protein SSD1
VPYVAIPVDFVPSEFLKDPAAFAQTMFAATVTDWPETTMHPYGRINGPLGQIGEIPVETTALLNDSGIDWDVFPEDVDACLPQMVSFNTRIFYLILFSSRGRFQKTN